MSTFAAIDFETANYDADSACAVAVVMVSAGRIVLTDEHLIRPPSSEFVFTHIHGLTWRHVRDSPTFGELWPAVSDCLDKVDFIAAHNAPFDRNVLKSCCDRYGVATPRQKFVCTVALARKQWGLYPTKLPDVCRHLDIPLDHHRASSDAEACARIVMAAEESGWRYAGKRRRRRIT